MSGGQRDGAVDFHFTNLEHAYQVFLESQSSSIDLPDLPTGYDLLFVLPAVSVCCGRRAVLVLRSF
jgi:hypothetical protein